MFSKVLVALDGSGVGAAIIPFVSLVARGLDVPIVLFSAISHDPSVAGSSTYASLYQQEEASAKVRLRQMSDELGQQGVRTETSVVSGAPAEQIVEAAARSGCDLIAMSTHGRNVLGRGILGSVTDQVVHSSSSPVLTITPDRADGYRERDIALSRIMVLLDGSELTETALPHAGYLAKAMSLQVLLVRVVSPMSFFWMDHYPADLADAQRELEDEANGYLQAATGRLAETGLDVTWEVLVGHPTTKLIEYARDTPHDLVVLATRGRVWLSRWALGSVAEALVRGSGDPVLMIPPPTEDSL